MFYVNFVKLCNSVGKSPSAVAEEIGVKRSTVTRWKQGKSVTDANCQKVADYFGVTMDELNKSEEIEKPTLRTESEPFPGYSDLTDEEKQKVSDYIDLLLAARKK